MTQTRTEIRDIRAGNGRDYRVFLSVPACEPPAAGFPALYLLDGNATFASVSMSAALQARRPAVTGVRPAIVVGIGFPTEDYLDPVRRTYDYTPPASNSALPARPDGAPWPDVGGADDFLDMLQDELKPALAEELPIDRARESIFGHSLGGLLVLHALFTRPESFQRYIAASPSIWFGERCILKARDAFLAREAISSTPAAALLVTVGDAEQASESGAAGGLDERAQWREHKRMVDNARDVIRSLESVPGLATQFHVFAGENHSSVLLPALGRALRFALASEPVA